MSRDPAAVREQALASMRDPRFHGLPPTATIEVRETHISTVYLAGDRALKVKKPVRLAFLDYGTLERRRLLCAEEVRLNREYAPGTYLGVRAIVPADGGFALGESDDPRAVEYAVEMRRLDETLTLDRLVRDGSADDELIARVARRIAELHAAAAPDEGPGTDGGRRAIAENLDSLEAHADGVLDRLVLAAVRGFAERFGSANRGLMAARAAAGRVRDGHGDLRTEHIVAENGLVIFDRVEFDERLRLIDVACDLAFTVMDLERLAAGPLARLLVDEYVAASNDAGLFDLVPFYACYRAAVRAKVACVRVEQLERRDRTRERLEREARSLLALALRFAWRSRLPLVFVLCGVGGSGKSTLAAEVAGRSGLPHVGSDAVRKELAGLAPAERGDPALYSPEQTARTYEELARRVAAAARDGGGAIVDATFRDRAHRLMIVESLHPTGARVLFCECRAPVDVLRSRARAREQAPELGSDATWDVISGQRGSFDPLDEVPPADRFTIETGRPVGESLAQLEERVGEAIDSAPRRPG